MKYEVRRAKLLKLDGTLRTSDEERETLVTFLTKHPRRVDHDEGVLAFLEAKERREARKQRKLLRESHALSTTKGLDCGRGASQHLAFEEYLRRPRKWIEDILAVDRYSVPPNPDSIEHYGALDIRVLLARGWFEGENVTGFQLGWDFDAIGGYSIHLFVDPRLEELPVLVARMLKGGDDSLTFQKIQLLAGSRSNKARHFLCPLNHLRCDILYFRNGIFASREGQGLYNPSQRAKGRKLRPLGGPTPAGAR